MHGNDSLTLGPRHYGPASVCATVALSESEYQAERSSPRQVVCVCVCVCMAGGWVVSQHGGAHRVRTHTCQLWCE